MALVAPVKVGMGVSADEGAKPPMSVEVMSGMVGSINATQIEIISAKIAEGVVERLGPRGKLLATQAVAFIKQSNGEELDKSEIAAQELGDQYNDEQFLTNRRMVELKIGAIELLKGIITSSFSTPRKFTEEGASFVLSGDEPQGFIKEAAVICRIPLEMPHIPPSYVVKLELDKEGTDEEELVFVLTESSSGIKVTKKCFTIQELEAERKLNIDMADSS